MNTLRLFDSDGTTPRGIVEGVMRSFSPTGEEPEPRGEYHPDLVIRRGRDGVWRQNDEPEAVLACSNFQVFTPDEQVSDDENDIRDYSDFDPEEDGSYDDVTEDVTETDSPIGITTGESVGSRKAATLEGLRTDEDPEWNNWKRSTRVRRQWMRHKRHRTRAPHRRLRDLPAYVDLHDGTMSLVRDHDDLLFIDEEEYFSVADGMSDEEIGRAATAAAFELWLDSRLDESGLEDTRPIEDVRWSDWDGDMFDRYGADPSYGLYDDWGDEDGYNDDLDKYETGWLGDDFDDDPEDERRGWSGPSYTPEEIDEITREYYEELRMREDAELDLIEESGPAQESLRQAVLATEKNVRFLSRRPARDKKRPKPWASTRPPYSLRHLLIAA